MKKVVLLAGVVAAGMAVAPVAANAAAPKNPEVLNATTGDAPYQDYEHYYSVLAARHTALELMKQDINDNKAPYSTFTDAAKTAVLADVEKQINDLDALQFAVKSLYDAMNVTEQQDQSYSTPAWEKAVDDAIDYITNKVTADEFDNLLDTYIEFAAQMKDWEEFNTWFNVDYDGDGLATVGYKTYITNRQATTYYKDVNEVEDVDGQIILVNADSNAFESLLGTAPALVDGAIADEMTATKKGNLNTLKTDLVQKQEALEDLVVLYHNDQTTLETTYTQKTPTGFDEKKNQDNVFSAGWKAVVDAAAEAAEDFIWTFDAADPATWNSAKTGEGATIETEAEYKSGAEALLEALQTAIDNEQANVTAYDQLMTVLNQAAADVDALRTTYWNKRKEGHAGSLAFPENDRYVYRALILDLEDDIKNDKLDVTNAFQNGTVTTDCVGLLGGKTAEEYLETLLQDIDDAEVAWAANEAANDAADVYFGRQDHHEASTADEAYYESFNLGSLRDDAKAANAHIDDHAAGQPFEVVEVYDPTTDSYVAKQINASDYNGDSYVCEHGETLHGFDKLYTDLQGARQAQFDYYNNIEAVAWNLLNVKDAEGNETGFVAEYKNYLNLLVNQASTEQAQLYTERAQAELDHAMKLAEELDDQCEEARACDDADCGADQKNPCGWHQAEAAAALEAIEGTDGSMNAANAAIDADHDAEEADDDTIAAAKAAGAAIEAEVVAWKALFDKADKDHKDKLDNTYEETKATIHKAIHEVVGQAEFDLHNFDNGDKAAADKWAQALENVDLDLDGAADTFADFEDFVAKLEAAEKINLDKAKELYELHHWTQLEALHQQVLAFQDVDTYMVPVNANRTARLELIAELDAKGADFKVLVDEVEAAEGTYYAADLATIDLAGIQGLIGNEATAIQDGYEAATLVDEVAAGTHDEAFLDIDEAINAARVALANAVKRYAANLVAYEALMDQYNNAVTDLKIFVDEAAATTVYNVEGHMDATAIMAAIANLQSNTDPAEADFAQVKDALDAALVAGTVVTNAEDLTDQVAALSAGVTALRTQLAGYVAFYNAEHALAADYNAQLANLETLLKSVVPGDIYGDRSDSEDLGELGDEYRDMIDILTYVENIEKLISTEDGKIAADLDAAKVQANAAAHETALATIETKIKELQKAVVDFEQFKADNQATRDALVNDLTNLLVVAEGLKNYGDVYGEDAEGYDAETIDRAIEDLENSINGDLSFLNAIDYPAGDLLLNEEQYRNSIDVVYAQDIQNIKDIIAGAEQLYAANLRALNNLEEHIKAVETVLHTTKAMCACNECNVEDQAEVDALLTTLDGILDDVNTAFTDTKDLWQQEGAFNGQVEDVEADAANLLALIQLHLDRVQNDLRVYNTLQTLLVSVDAEMLKLEAEEGYEHFKIRGAHLDSAGTMCQYIENNSNPNVKYGNELAQMVEDLKAEIERQHSHEGGHSCEENKIADVKAMNDIKAEIEKTIAAIKANEAAHKLLKERFAELFADAKDAYEFWNKYYSTATLITHEGDIANWIQEWNGELENGYALAGLENLLHDYYVHGNAANAWTVDGKGEELNGDANDKFAKYDEDLANDRNELAHTEALNHYAQVKEIVDTYYNNTKADYSSEVDGVTSWDPFVRKWENGKFVGVYEDWSEEVEGEYGLYASLSTFEADIKAAYEEGVMEDAINIDNHNTALGIHQQLDGVLGVLTQIEAEYAALFEAAHHLTNGKTVYSDQEYFTLGFFQKANDGLGFQGQEMFNTVVVNDMDKINVLDLTAYESETVYDDPTDFNSPYTTTYATDADGNLIRENNGYATDVQVLVNGDKQNELTFNIPQPMAPLAVTTLLAGPADIEFLRESITVDEWTTKHNVYISFNVAEPVVEENQDLDGVASSNKLIVRVANPVDLTYTSKVLVATTNTGDQFSFADATFNTAKGQIEFDLPEGTESVVLPEGFFTFRTGENTIARSAACTIAVAGATSIEGLIAMGEKAQIFDLQGRRVKAEALISGNTYVVNGEKVMVK